jgi:stage II sporulation protein D
VKAIISTFSFLALFIEIISAQKIDVGLFQHLKTDKLFIEASSGKYKIKGDGKKLYRLKKDRNIILKYANGMISVSNSKKDFGLCTNIQIVALKYNYNKSHDKPNSRRNSELNIKLITPKQDTRTYQGNLKVRVYNKQLEISNQIAMPDYLAGVVEAESGPNEVIEYYKNQATICRTYALKNLEKHKKEGFHLCDGVHCQAYKGKSTKNKIIPEAVKETKDLVIVDNQNQLIEALFSANCGGQTNNSEDVWTSALPYLRSITDSFCTDQRQAFWTKKIEFNSWKNFLKENSITIEDTLSIDSFIFSQPKRIKNYTINNQDIKLTSLRYGLKLRSTFFSIKPDGNNLILSGRGYGHGVGMCQEGAMNMAKKGFSFDKIIKYYYKGVKIISLGKLTTNPLLQ